MLKRIKDRLYYYFAEKNWGVRREYGPYVDEHQEEHQKHRIKHWWLLVRLNWHYRVRRKTEWLMAERNKPDCENIHNLLDRYPCINGAESEETYRQPLFRLAMDLLEYDVISFDIFDTLLLRPFKTPQDLFYLVGQKLDFTGYHMDFYSIRKSCEIEARRNKFEKFGHREISIHDIYKEIAKVTNIDPDIGAEIEFQTELEFCMPNPYMLEVFKILRSFGKRIVVVSDMYFSHDYIERMLNKIGVSGYEKLYVSCDYNVSKANGLLYEVVLNDLEVAPEQIIHVGDNFKVDVQEAQKKRINARHYRSVANAGAKHRPKTMSNVVGAFYAGIVNAHIHSGYSKYSPAYEYGYIYAGLYILGMVNWIHKKIVSENIEQVLFLSRDGYIYKKVYDMFFHDADTQYCYWSRHSAMRCDVAEKNFEEIFRRYVDHRIESSKKHGLEGVYIGSLLDSMGISNELRNDLHGYGLYEDIYLSESNKANIRRYLLDHRQEILSDYINEKEYIAGKYCNIIGQNKKIALIDTGWTGNNVLSLRRMINEVSDEEKIIKVWLAGALPCSNFTAFLDDTIDCYLFSPTNNREFHRLYTNKESGVVNTLSHELMNQTTQPSYITETTERMFFDLPQVEDYHFLKEIEHGIIDFCIQYWEKSKPYTGLRNISATDAMAPISLILNCPEYINNTLSQMHITSHIGTGGNRQKVENLGSMLEGSKT